MKLGAVVGMLVLFATVSCGREEREFNAGGGAGSTAQGGESGAGSGSSAGGEGEFGADAGAAGMPDGNEEPTDLCVGKVCDAPPADECLSDTEFQSYDKVGSCDEGSCSYTQHLIACSCMDGACTTDPCIGLTCDTPPAALCKDANTVTTYAESGTCDEGSCDYAATTTDCAGAGKCKDLGTSAECVACLSNADCSNSGTCNAAGSCVCSVRYNGPHCEFQVFRGIGTLSGDASSYAFGVSADGSIVVGGSYRADGFGHAVRSINGGALEFIAEPASLTTSTGCQAMAVDSSGTVLLNCDSGPPEGGAEGGSSFLRSNGGSDLAITGGSAYDISLDGKVIVGTSSSSPEQGFRKVGSVTAPLGVLAPGGWSSIIRTNGDGSVAVGRASLAAGGWAAARWTAALGLVALPKLVNWNNPTAQDVSTDGKVIVGDAQDSDDYVAVKWSGAGLSPTILGAGHPFCTNADGSVSGGADESYSSAMLWDSMGQRAVKDLLGATPDLNGWSLSYVSGISDDGKVVVGNGTHGTKAEGWVVHLP